MSVSIPVDGDRDGRTDGPVSLVPLPTCLSSSPLLFGQLGLRQRNRGGEGEWIGEEEEEKREMLRKSYS